MDNRIEPPRDYVVRPCRQPETTRYDRVGVVIRRIGTVLAFAAVVGVTAYVIAASLTPTAHADPVSRCHMVTPAQGYCRH